jgi:hypothetical protein
MTEDNFEKFIKQAARDYNAPPARVPRDEMWSAIQARRAAGPRVVYGGGLTPEATPVRRLSRTVWLGAAAAAMLLVATGVGIGRWSAAPVPPTRVATLPSTAPVVVTPPAPANASDNGTDGGATPSLSPSQLESRAGGSRVGVSPVRTPSRSGGDRQVAVTPGLSAQSAASAYQLTTVSHLTEAEALLTSFRARSSADQQMDAQLGAWARQLLSNTRLLLDSPVANDPQRRPLLQDLELVLVQIVQLSPGSAPQDRELIEKTLQQEHVLTRLRTAIPAGAQRGS